MLAITSQTVQVSVAVATRDPESIIVNQKEVELSQQMGASHPLNYNESHHEKPQYQSIPNEIKDDDDDDAGHNHNENHHHDYDSGNEDQLVAQNEEKKQIISFDVNCEECNEEVV